MIVPRCSLKLFSNCGLDVYSVLNSWKETNCWIWRYLKTQGTQTVLNWEWFCPTGDIWLCLEMSFDYHDRRGVASGIWWIEGRGAAQCGQDKAPTPKNYPVQDVNIAEVEKAWVTYLRKKYHLFRHIEIYYLKRELYTITSRDIPSLWSFIHCMFAFEFPLPHQGLYGVKVLYSFLLSFWNYHCGACCYFHYES